MAKTDSTFIYVASNPSETAARADYQVVKDYMPAVSSGPTTPQSSPRTPMARSMRTRTRRRPSTDRADHRGRAAIGAIFPRRSRRRGRRRIGGGAVT